MDTAPQVLQEQPSPLRGCRLQRDLVAKVLEPPGETALHGLSVALLEVEETEVLVGHAAVQQVAGDDEDAVPHRHHRLLPAEADDEPAILGRLVGITSAAGPATPSPRENKL